MSINSYSLKSAHDQQFVVDLDQIEGRSLPEILELVEHYDTHGLSNDDLHRTYFLWSEDKGLNVSSGVVGTPRYVADFMVRETLSAVGHDPSKLRWYDPCCGSGIFLESILNICRIAHGPFTLEQLPKITAAEISSAGMFCTILVINNLLRAEGLTVSDYLDSTKLRLVLGDSLALYEEAPSLLGRTLEKHDVAIGNPPYVRASRLPMDIKRQLRRQFPSTYYGTADLYFYFLSSATLSLNTGGVLCFISPANFFRSVSGTPLRSFLAERTEPIKVVDLDELPVFSNADIHTAMYWLRHDHSTAGESDFSYAHLTSLIDLDKLRNFTIEYEQLPKSNISKNGWRFSSASESRDLGRYRNLVALKDIGLPIYSGIRPGSKRAFVHDQHTLNTLSDKIVGRWTRPCVEAKTIEKWVTPEGHKRLVMIEDSASELPSELAKLLEPHENTLRQRYESQKGTKWFALRPCSYYDIFEKPRIVFPDISSKPKFSLDTTSNIALDGTFVIPTANLALLGILNSQLAWNYFLDHCSSIGNAKNKGRLRLKKSHVEKFPIPRTFIQSPRSLAELSDLVETIILAGETPQRMNQLNQLVDTIYDAHQ